ncbi:hypothetical protein LTR66_000452 [Elasticomyces elasticus]|nr:hypothetical protein LTR66_000452 [Elasticomyces elasticus]
MAGPRKPPKALVFDIGGVCAILDYENDRDIPNGWINHSIAKASPNGAWHRLERGEIPLDAAYFAEFKRDLSDETLWRSFYAQHLARTRKESIGQAVEEAAYAAPPVPDIDAEKLFWTMMTISRTPDPIMFPALQRLREYADRNPGKLLLGALSNTVVFPPGHEFNDPETGESHGDLRGLFHVFVSSAHVGLRKPDPAIYNLTVKMLNEWAERDGSEIKIDLGDVVFLDDIGANLKAARALGMRTVKVELGRVEHAVRELEEILGIDLRGSAGKAKL